MPVASTSVEIQLSTSAQSSARASPGIGSPAAAAGVGKPLHRLQGEISDVSELLLRALEEQGERQLAAEQVEVDEIALAPAADDRSELHQAEVERRGDREIRAAERLDQRIGVVVEAQRERPRQLEGEVAVAGGVDPGPGGHLQEIHQQVAPVLGREPIGERHQIETSHRPVPEIERQRRPSGEIEIRAPGPLAEPR